MAVDGWLGELGELGWRWLGWIDGAGAGAVGWGLLRLNGCEGSFPGPVQQPYGRRSAPCPSSAGNTLNGRSMSVSHADGSPR